MSPRHPVAPDHYSIAQAAIILSRAPKTLLNMLYYHHFPRRIQRYRARYYRVLTPGDLQRLRSLLPPVKTYPPTLRKAP